MNERIKDLAEQASHQSPDGYPVTIPYSQDFAKKFAELIINDCVTIAEKAGHCYECGGGPFIADALTEHFGIAP
jgi:hypothetical protein